MKKILFSILLTHCINGTIKAQDTAKTNATLKSATVYFGYGAELTHHTNTTITKKTKQIIINYLATALDINSLQINVPENVALLSQKFNVYYPTQPIIVNPMIKKLNDSILILRNEISRINNQIDIEQQTMDKTGKLIELTITGNGNKTITSDEALKLVNAYTTKIEKAKTNIFSLGENKSNLSLKINSLQQQINEASRPAPTKEKPYGQLCLQIVSNYSGEIPITLSYFTNNAGFTPLYDVRVNSKTNEIKLVYKASVSQHTGIDWKQTKLTLSTANPNWSGTAPILNPWYLQFFVPRLYGAMQNNSRSNLAYNTIPGVSMAKDEEMLKEVIIESDNVYKKSKSLTGSYQTINPSNLSSYTTLNESQLNTNFEIDLPYDINSDGELQSVVIREEKLIAILKNYAVPKLDKDPYLLAELTNWQNLNLLPGTANIIMDDTYLGKTMIDPNITSDTLNLSLGKDKRIAVKRTLVKELTTTKTSGSTTKQIFTYEIVLKNNKTTDVQLLLKDQYPLSQVKEIETILVNNEEASINEELGILNWQINLKPGESKKVRFSYTVKYPGDKKISNL
jgi:uncharacterized protein (TIGR02231 family)